MWLDGYLRGVTALILKIPISGRFRCDNLLAISTKKQNQDFQEVNDEFNEFLEDEVEKRVEEKMKTFEKQINKLTKSTFSKKKKK